MSTVWVVEQGEYSDYRVLGVFSSEANARLIADTINKEEFHGEDATVAEWPLDPAVDALRQGQRQFHLVMLVDGTVERIEPNEISGYDIAGNARIWRRTQAPAYKGKGVPDALQATVWANDETHAIKIANEQRAQMIASGKWASGLDG